MTGIDKHNGQQGEVQQVTDGSIAEQTDAVDLQRMLDSYIKPDEEEPVSTEGSEF